TPVTVLRFEDNPDASFYQAQSLHEGLQYIQARDGTLLAAMVRPPLGKTLAQGPFPTVVEYSGYAAADPDSPQPSTLITSAPGFPGGIFNNGFAQTWLQERKDDAQPAPAGGQQYARKRVNNGDTTCLANQQLRLQTLDPVEFTRTHRFYVPSLMDQRSPINW